MSERQVRARWHGGYRCEVRAGRFTIPVDEPEHVGGTDTGPQPTDLLLASVGSCFALALSHSAGKRSIPVGSIAVAVTGEYDGPRFRSIRVHAEVGCDPDRLDALLRAAERVCYVTNTLRGGPDITITGEVTDVVDVTTDDI